MICRVIPGALRWIFGKARAQDLDCDVAVKEFVMRKMHDRHPALADHLDQPVAASEDALGQYHPAIGW